VIYLDNAATSWPKPPEVLRAMTEFLETAGGNPGRSGHRMSIQAGRVLYDAREALAQLFHAPDPLRVIFTHNATHALNLALIGLLRPGDRVVTSSIEHNSMMRPLRALQKDGVEVAEFRCHADTTADLDDAARAIRPGTRLVAFTHASNVSGALLPVADIARMAHAAGALVLVDAAQTAGCVPLDMQALGVDLLAFSGHKGLLGPPGTGALILGDTVDAAAMRTVLRGGTGSRSEFQEQPEDLPDKFESGTPNAVGIAGLLAATRYVQARGVENIRAHEMQLAAALARGLVSIPEVTVLGPAGNGDGALRSATAVMSFTVARRSVSEIGLRLDEECGIMSRVGLHCAPSAHRVLGTFPEGAVRFAPGAMTERGDVDAAIEAVKNIVQG
jgi:cysteine desulfurase family protein